MKTPLIATVPLTALIVGLARSSYEMANRRTPACVTNSNQNEAGKRRKLAPAPPLSALLRQWPVFLRADFVLVKDPKWLYYYNTPLCLFATELPFVGPFWVLGKDEIGP